MASSTTKKVQVYRFEREALSGYVIPNTFQANTGIELLLLSGSAVVIPYPDIKFVTFVRDFGETDTLMERRAFLTRPKLDGLWVRMIFRDQDILEGVLPNDLLHMGDQGFTLTPPDSTQRVFVPRAALNQVQVLGVVGSPLRPAKKKAAPPPKEQIKLFE